MPPAGIAPLPASIHCIAPLPVLKEGWYAPAFSRFGDCFVPFPSVGFVAARKDGLLVIRLAPIAFFRLPMVAGGWKEAPIRSKAVRNRKPLNNDRKYVWTRRTKTDRNAGLLFEA